MGMLILLLIAPIGLGLVALALAALGQWFEDLFKFFDYNEVSSPCEAIAACRRRRSSRSSLHAQ